MKMEGCWGSLPIKSSVYPHKHIHQGTWKIPGTNKEVNQVDHVLVSKRHSSSIKDVRSCRGPNSDSNRYLVKVQVQEKLANIQEMTKITSKKWDTDQLIKQPEVGEEYESKLQMRLQNRDAEGSEDIERKWNEMDSIIKGVAIGSYRREEKLREINSSMENVLNI
jgi:hypothetical protein